MFFYFNVSNTASAIQSKIVSVSCEKCGCAYCYEMTRIGTGINVSHYGIAWHSPGATAERQAKSEAKNRLINEAELVPCPKCRWINDDLVSRYRSARFRGLGALAICLGFGGIAGTLIWALMLYINYPAERGAVPYVVVWGALVSVVSAVAVFVLRIWLRHQIQPNRFFPQAPDVPAGTPPPLILNERKELVIALPATDPNDLQLDATSMEFQIGRHAFPDLCCICMDDADPKSAFSIEPILGISLPIPICTGCARNALLTKLLRGAVAAIGIFAFISVVLLMVGANNPEVFFIVGGASVGLGWFIGELSFRPIRAKVIDASRGTLRLFFANPAFRSQIYEVEPIQEETPEFSFLNQQEFN